MRLILNRKSLRAAGLAVLAAISLSIIPGAARSAEAPSIVKQLEAGEPALAAELTNLALAARNRDYISEAFTRYGLQKESDAVIRARLQSHFRREPKEWAVYYACLKRLALRSGSGQPGSQAKGPIPKGLLHPSPDYAKDLDGTFDGRRPIGPGLGANPLGPPPSPVVGEDGRETPVFNWGDEDRKPPTESADRIGFDDVIGIDEAKGELMEIVDMMRNPERYRRTGADIPRGVLMAGPPGTGKTFTARALANEAGVTFMAMEGTAFIDKYVGESAKKVREFFAKARDNAPCIVFIDEIEALAGKRLDGDQGAERETNGAVTQLLVEMDGLTEEEDGTKPLVIVVGATNRVDMLDPAVLRPGRFDRKVIFNLPDVNGRQKLIDVYVKKKKVPSGKDVDTKVIAQRTTGMSPADIKNLVNEAAVLSARDNKVDAKVKTVDQRHFIRAIDRLVMGKERKIALTEEEKRDTAIHELGHAIVGQLVPNGDPISKITIIPRDIGALGVTVSEPPEDRKNWTKNQLEARIAMAMGGRVAELMFIGELTTGASSDLENAENIARQMVMSYGMSGKLGPISYSESGQGNYINGARGVKPISEATQRKIDAEVSRILHEQENRAKEVLTAHKATLLAIVPVLVEKETLEGSEFKELIKKFEGGNGGNIAKEPKGSGGPSYGNTRSSVGPRL